MSEPRKKNSNQEKNVKERIKNLFNEWENLEKKDLERKVREQQIKK